MAGLLIDEVFAQKDEEEERVWKERVAAIHADTDLPNPGDRLKEKREKIMWEVLTTEKTFVENLRVLAKIYREPLERTADSAVPIITRKKLERLFPGVNDLEALNTQLFSDLRKGCWEWTETGKSVSVGKIFKYFTPFLKRYAEYTDQYDDVLYVLNKKLKDHSFSSFVKTCEENSNGITKTLTLRDYLITPVQRIPRYVLLLTDLKKNTKEDDEDYAPLTAALEEMSKVAAYVNQRMKESEMREKVLSVQNRIMKAVDIVEPQRVHIREGVLKKLCRKALKPRMVFLFNDCIVYASILKDSLFTKHLIVKFEDVFRIEDDKDDTYQHMWSIVGSKKSFCLAASSAEEKQSWFQATRKAFDEFKAGAATTHQEEIRPKSMEAPKFIPDSRSKRCMVCDREFTLTFRRHHCRKCGIIVCNLCSARKMEIPELQVTKPERVCDPCYKEARASDPRNCTLCAVEYSQFTKKLNCRICGHNVCKKCSRSAKFDTGKMEVPICSTCFDDIKIKTHGEAPEIVMKKMWVQKMDLIRTDAQNYEIGFGDTLRTELDKALAFKPNFKVCGRFWCGVLGLVENVQILCNMSKSMSKHASLVNPTGHPTTIGDITSIGEIQLGQQPPIELFTTPEATGQYHLIIQVVDGKASILFELTLTVDVKDAYSDEDKKNVKFSLGNAAAAASANPSQTQTQTETQPSSSRPRFVQSSSQPNERALPAEVEGPPGTVAEEEGEEERNTSDVKNPPQQDQPTTAPAAVQPSVQSSSSTNSTLSKVSENSPTSQPSPSDAITPRFRRPSRKPSLLPQPQPQPQQPPPPAPQKPRSKTIRTVWLRFKSEDGRAYFQKIDGSETVWEVPRGGSVSWDVFVTPEGTPYYFNLQTKETFWERPSA